MKKLELEVTYKVVVKVDERLYNNADDDVLDAELDRLAKDNMCQAKLQKVSVTKEIK